MRVAHVGNFNPDSADGTEKTIAGLAGWLPSYGVEIEVWQLSRTASCVVSRWVDGVRVWDLPAHTPPLSFVRGITPAAQEFVRVRQRSLTHVHFHSGFVPEVPLIAGLLRVPYVMTPNGMYSSANVSGRDGRFKRWWLRVRDAPCVRRAAMLHAVSAGEAEGLAAVFPEVPRVLIPNALDLQAIPLDTRHSERGRDLNLLYLGRLAVEQKGLDLLLRAYARYLARSGDTRTRLQLVGPDYRDGLTTLRALARELGVEHRTEFHAAVFGAAKWHLIARAHALVHPSRWDGMPFSVLEAMATGRPVLVTPGTNLDDVVAAHGAGTSVDASVEDIANGLERLVSLTEGEWSAMGAAARRIVQTQFTWSEAAARMAEVYRAVLNDEDGRAGEAIKHVA